MDVVIYLLQRESFLLFGIKSAFTWSLLVFCSMNSPKALADWAVQSPEEGGDQQSE